MRSSRKSPPVSSKLRGSPRWVRSRGGRLKLAVDCDAETPKTRARKREQARRTGFVAAVWLIIGFCLVGLGITTWKQTLHQNPRFGLKEVTVVTDGALTPQRLVKEMGLVEGMDTLWLNLRVLREKAEKLPQVKSASIRRDYHGQMEIFVEQRQPVAWLECNRLGLHSMKSGLGCLLDDEGVAMPCEVILKPYTELPVIRYEDLSQVHPGSAVKDFQVVAALALKAELISRQEHGLPVLEAIDIPAKYAMVAMFRDGMEVTFSPDAWHAQLDRLDRVMAEADANGWKIATLNLIPRDNVPVTFRSPPKLAGR